MHPGERDADVPGNHMPDGNRTPDGSRTPGVDPSGGHLLGMWTSRLSSAGYRVTSPRRAVIRVLVDSPTALTPEEILTTARGDHVNLGLATVYRCLQLFTDLDLARRVHRDDGCHAYLSSSPGHTHAVICCVCGRGAEFPGIDDVRRLAARVEKTTGFRVSDHLLQFFGMCPACQARSR